MVIMAGYGSPVTEGLVLLAAWAEFLVLLGLLCFFVLCHREPQ